jgi:hypothetical protein
MMGTEARVEGRCMMDRDGQPLQLVKATRGSEEKRRRANMLQP